MRHKLTEGLSGKYFFYLMIALIQHQVLAFPSKSRSFFSKTARHQFRQFKKGSS